ncbi:MAG: ApaG protein, partial [Rhodospirillaceae bacterium]|nr:ApaG protein [Rhodospirillaceae bacterium]
GADQRSAPLFFLPGPALDSLPTGRRMTHMYRETTHDITITVKPYYLEDQSSPDQSHYVWAYHVRIENNGGRTVQLRNRYWRITDSRGRVQEVRGAGVVGEQPVLRPGDSFEYTSGTPLPTPSGIMGGSYQMEASETGERFDVTVPSFSLDSPHQPIKLN